VSAAVNSGGTVVVEAGAVASAATVMSGGRELVFSGGTAAGTIIQGGNVEVASGGLVVSAPVGFSSSRGTLKLDASMSFSGVISGFTVPGNIELRDIPFISGTTSASFVEAASNQSGTLTVGNGTASSTANITMLGHYVTGNFIISSDGYGGTNVIDPPVGAPAPDANALDLTAFGIGVNLMAAYAGDPAPNLQQVIDAGQQADAIISRLAQAVAAYAPGQPGVPGAPVAQVQDVTSQTTLVPPAP
jgi:autotransporter passenger strand-loop-strand repeat protein